MGCACFSRLNVWKQVVHQTVQSQAEETGFPIGKIQKSLAEDYKFMGCYFAKWIMNSQNMKLISHNRIVASNKYPNIW